MSEVSKPTNMTMLSGSNSFSCFRHECTSWTCV